MVNQQRLFLAVSEKVSMQIALFNGQRSTARPKSVGKCQYCGREMIAKCGSVVIWHWAHKSRRRCDPWWENETEWHREWKAKFPLEWQEVIFHAADGERHIADVLTKDGKVIEFQHSSMPLKELSAREAFYHELVWVVDATPFLSGFHILTKLPPPNSDAGKRLDIMRPPRHPVFEPDRRGIFANQPLYFWPEHSQQLDENVKVYDVQMIANESSDYKSYDNPRSVFEEIEAMDTPYRFLDWPRPRKAWLKSKRPVYFDLGGADLWRLDRFQDYLCVEKVEKITFINKFLT